MRFSSGRPPKIFPPSQLLKNLHSITGNKLKKVLEMKMIWSYLVVVLWACVTSARVLNFPGNSNGLQGNLFSTVKKENVLTPPSSSGLIIDSNGYLGNSNGENIEEINPNDLPQFFDEIIKAVLKDNQSKDYQIIPFNKDEISQLAYSNICKNMCLNGIKKAPCNCKKFNNIDI